VGHWGTFVTTPQVDSANATVTVRTHVDNQDSGARRAVLRSLIVDASGKEIARTDTSFVVEAGQGVELQQQLAVASPRRWSVETPTLYTLRSTVLVAARVVDDYTTRFGIRTIAYDQDRGFLLNGERVKLLGVNLHHDGGAVGAAVPERVWERRLEVLKRMGANAIRTAHNPPAPEFLDLADRMGFLVMDEAFDEWTGAKVSEGYNKYFGEWSERDLVDLMRRDRNHPSVVLWSLGNEIAEQSQPGGDVVLRRLLDIAHREDPTRPVTTGNDHIAADPPRATVEFLNALDIVGYNYVDRWHERRELYAEQDRHDHPEWRLIGIESVPAGNAFGGAYSLGDDPKSVRPNYTAGMIRAEALWKWVALHDYFAGDFMWTGVDYLGESRWPSKGFAAAPIDITGRPKDSFFLYKSLWSNEPVLHLFPHWNWPGREGQTIPVLAYTNCNAVELFLNDRSLGEKRLEFPMQGASGGWNTYERPQVFPTTTDLHLTWDVPYAPGVLRAVGKRAGDVVCQAEVRTAGAPAAIRLRVDRDTIAADPRNVAHIAFEIVDPDGTVAPTADNLVRLVVEGGTMIALDNANLHDHTSYQSDSRRAFNGKGMAVVRASRPGKMRVTASADRLRSATVEITVRRGAVLPMVPAAQENR
jgi:beta-galactosidase